MTADDAIRRILVIRLSSIGDIILTTPVVEQLGRAFPGAVLDYCTKGPFAPLLEGNPAVSSVYTPESLPPSRYDLVVDLQNNARSRALLRRIDSGDVRRYRKENWKKFLLVHCKIDRYRGECPSVVERYRAPLAGLLPSFNASCALYPPPEALAFAGHAVDGAPVLAVCFGATHYTKRYPAARFAEVIAMVAEAMPVDVLLLGGKEDVAGAEAILASLPASCRGRVRSFAGKTSLQESAALLQRADAVLTNDTGLMHMASAFARKLIVLFGSSVREFGFLPWGTPYELLEVEGLACRPCSHIGRGECPKGHFRCMNDIPPGRVASRVIESLKLQRR